MFFLLMLFIAVRLGTVFVSNGSLVYSSIQSISALGPLPSSHYLSSPGRPSRSAWLLLYPNSFAPMCVC